MTTARRLGLRRTVVTLGAVMALAEERVLMDRAVQNPRDHRSLLIALWCWQTYRPLPTRITTFGLCGNARRPPPKVPGKMGGALLPIGFIDSHRYLVHYEMPEDIAAYVAEVHSRGSEASGWFCPSRAFNTLLSPRAADYRK